MMTAKLPVQLIIFDLDDTLYSQSLGLFAEVRVRIEGWLMRTLNLSLEEAQARRAQYFKQYGTTLAGLQQNYPDFDLEGYLDFVHDAPIEAYLHPDPALAAMLERLPGRKAIFTNSTRLWAERSVASLGIAGYFDEILDIRAVDYRPKPRVDSYARALELLGTPGEVCAMLDDQPRNLQAGATLGMRTILVRPDGQVGEGVDAAVATVLEAEPILLQWVR